jgi:hypothetical protein
VFSSDDVLAALSGGAEPLFLGGRK